MAMKRRVWTAKVDRPLIAFTIGVDDFDELVNEGWDDIMVVTPHGRYVASLEDWLDYSYIDLDGDAEVRVMHFSYMGRA